jgi:ADP-ribose pyrophosphatase YjhB (NUDIX family)
MESGELKEGNPRNPFPTVDAIIVLPGEKIVLVKRKNPPHGWALPGGFVSYGESMEDAVVREAKEETSLDIEIIRQLHTYSDPGRDPRFHTVSTVFVARADGDPVGGDDASLARAFSLDELPDEMAFDHRRIIDDFLAERRDKDD